MNPSNVGNSGFLLGALLAGFLLWLLVNNRLGTYWNLLIGGGGSSTGSSSPATTGSLLNPASPSFNPAQAGQSLGQQFRTWLGF